MKERPILMGSDMVKALLKGSKTQTRRIVKDKAFDKYPDETDFLKVTAICPYGHVGDRLWVRETFCNKRKENHIDYKASFCDPQGFSDSGYKWQPSIFMPRAASRLLLEITGIRIERLQDISEDDAIAEGINKDEKTGLYQNYLGQSCCFIDPTWSYSSLWNSINGEGKFGENPFVWVIEFKVLPPSVKTF